MFVCVNSFINLNLSRGHKRGKREGAISRSERRIRDILFAIFTLFYGKWKSQ